MKIYNSSIVDIKYNLDGNEYFVPAKGIAEITDAEAKRLIGVYGFLVEPTEDMLKQLNKVKKATKKEVTKVVKKRK